MKLTSFSQIPSDIVNNFYIYFDIDRNVKNSEATQNINYRPWFVTDRRSYITPNNTPIGYALLTQRSKDDSLELNLINRLQQFDKVERIYLSHNENLIQVKVLVQMETYDYKLMDKLINDVEFPIKDSYKSKLIDFEYIPNLPNQEPDIYSSSKLIYNKKANEVVFGSTITFSYENPLENIHQVNICLP